MLVRLHLQNCVEFWLPRSMKDKDALEKAQRRPMKMSKGLESMHWEEGQRKLSLFSLEKAHHIIWVLKWWLQRRQKLSVHKEKTRGYRHKLLQARFHPNTRKIWWWSFFWFGLIQDFWGFCYSQTINYWMNLPKNTIDTFPMTGGGKTGLDRVPGSLT